jgi:hypothetical protein
MNKIVRYWELEAGSWKMEDGRWKQVGGREHICEK